MGVGERFLCVARDRPSLYGHYPVGAVSNRAYGGRIGTGRSLLLGNIETRRSLLLGASGPGGLSY